MAERQLLVKIVGDDKQLQRTFKSSEKAAAGFNSQMKNAADTTENSFVRIRAGRGKSIGLLRIAGIGLGAGVAFAAATRAVAALQKGLEVTGDQAGTFSGQIRNMSAALLGGDVVGAVKALQVNTLALSDAQLKFLETSPKTIEQLKGVGFAAAVAAEGMAKLVALTQTPLIIQLRGARASETPGTADDVKSLRAQITQKTAAIEGEKKLRALGVSENDIVAAIIKLTNDRKALTDRLNAIIEAENKARTAAAKRAKDAASKPFRESVKGLGLKAEKAKLTQSLNDDIAASEELIKTIQRQIKVEGRTFDLEEQLIQARLGRGELIRQKAAAAEAARTAAAEKAAAAKQKSQDAFDAIIDSLSLNLDIAGTTKSLVDDQKALRQIEAAILNRIKSEGRTTALLKQLFDVRQQEEDVTRQIAEQRQKGRQGDIFERLGLTREGEEKVPGGASLRKRASSLLEQIKGTALDTDKNRKILRGIVNTTNKDFRQAGRSLRNAILGMLNDISSALSGGDESGPLTKTHGLRTAQIIKNLGLSPEQADEIQRRLAHVTSGGSSRAAGGGGRNLRDRSQEGHIVVESHTTINLDGHTVANVVTRNQQKDKRRNPKQKRGPNRGD